MKRLTSLPGYSKYFYCFILTLLTACSRNVHVSGNNNEPLPGHSLEIKIEDQHYQTIKGWGVFPGWPDREQGWDVLTSMPVQKAIYQDLGINVIRLEIHHSYYTDKGVLNTELIDRTLVKMIEQARKYQPAMGYITTIWSAPAAWKTCGITRGRCSEPSATPVVPNHLKTENEDDLIKASADVIKYLAFTKGLGLPMGHSIQNELTSPVKWDGTVYTKEQYQRVIKNMREYFDQNGLSQLNIMGPEGGETSSSWEMLGGTLLSDLKKDKELDRSINTLISHTYDQWDNPRPSPAELKEYGMASSKTGKDLWMTEWCTVAKTDSTNEMEKLISELQHFTRDMVLGQYNYWLYWLGWRKNKQDIGEAMLRGNAAEPTFMKRYWVYQKLFNNIPPGSVVKHLSTNDPHLKGDNALDLHMLAFDRGKTEVVLLINPTSNNKNLLLKGLEGSSIHMYQTSAIRNMTNVTPEDAAVIDGETQLSLDAQSIVVIVTE